MAEFPTLANIFEPLTGKTGADANTQMRAWYNGTRQLPGAAPTSALTIAGDALTPTGADHTVNTEGSAPADNLQIIKTGSTHDGMILALRAVSASRTVTVVASSQMYGITLWGGAATYTLSTTERLVLQRVGNVWKEIRGVVPTAANITTILTDAAESATLPATTSATLAALLQTVRNCLKWILARMDFRTSSVTIYVRTDGNDSNNGFTNSATGAVASWTGVFEVLRRLNMRDSSVNVRFQGGTWPGVILAGDSIIGSGGIKLYVYGVTKATFFSSGIYVDSGWARFYDCTFRSNASGRYGGHLELYNPEFIGADTATIGIEASDGGTVFVETALLFYGAFTQGILAQTSGFIRMGNNLPITFGGNCTFSYYLFAGSTSGSGEIAFRGTPTYTGTFAGQKYYMQYGSKITGKTLAQLDALPGTIAGRRSAGAGVTQSPQFVSSGTSSASNYLLADGTDLVSLFGDTFPKPTSSTWVLLWGSPATLPPGGTWACFYWVAGKEHYMGAGIRSGGSTVGGSGETYIGFAWRIA